jgi:carbon-monoxide dehydrogenase medium subunit
MIPNNFKYHRATSIDDAITLMVKYGDDAKILAGGHSLLPAMKLRLNQPEVLIDIGRIQDLRYIKKEGNELIIGAGATHHDLATSELASSHLRMLSEAADLIGDVQVRNMGTIGGSIAHADPSADWPAVLIAAKANIAVKGPNGSRTVSADDFFEGFFTTALEENELVTAIHVPAPPAGSKSSYKKFMQPASRFAIVGCAAVVSLDAGKCKNVSIAINGLADHAFRATNVEDAIRGYEPTEENLDNAVANVGDGEMIMEDHYASEAYRLHLARVFTRRAIVAATTETEM